MVEGKVTVKEIFFYEDRMIKGGVSIYKIENNDANLLFADFYIVTFDDGTSEIVWGAGDTPQSALESASREWDVIYGYEDNEYLNPFEYVLRKVEEGKISLPKL